MKSVSDVPGRAIIFAALDPAIKNGLAENRTNIILRQLDAAGLVIVPKEPTEAMWGELARDIIMWTRFGGAPTGYGLHSHLRSIGRAIPEWLIAEIPETTNTPPKGTVAACIYKAMIEASTPTPSP